MKTLKNVTKTIARIFAVLLAAFILVPKNNSTAQIHEISLKVKVKAGVQGYFNASTGKLCRDVPMHVELRQCKSPYDLVSSTEILIDKNTMTAIANFDIAESETYYIVLRHNNALEVWSKDGGEFLTAGIVNEFDFTSSGSAYGDNQYDNGKYRFMYSGDVDQNGIIDGADLALVDNALTAFAVDDPSDLNGDGWVDGSDLLIAEENSTKYLVVSAPEGTENSYASSNIKNLDRNSGTNYPNPFNPTTNIGFNLPSQSQVNLSIYDITGRLVKTLVNQILSSGYHEYKWDAGNMASGTYFYRITSPGFEVTKQMNLIK